MSEPENTSEKEQKERTFPLALKVVVGVLFWPAGFYWLLQAWKGNKTLSIAGSIALTVVVVGLVSALPTDDKKTATSATSTTSTTAEPDTSKPVVMVTDVEGSECESGTTKYGRCPESEYFGKTMAEVRAEKAAQFAAARLAEKAAREEEQRQQAEYEAENKWHQGYIMYSETIAFKWASDECDNSTFGCYGMDMVTKDGCDSLYVELQLQDSQGSAIGYTNDTASALEPGQVAKLDFTDVEDKATNAKIAKVNCY